MRDLILLACLIVTTGTIAPAQEPQTGWLTGQDFEQRLQDPGLASFSGQPLRSVLQQIEQSYQLACFRDRRIDSDQIVELSGGPGNIRRLLGAIAEASGAAVSLPGNVVYLGPNSKARLLRTLIQQRTIDVRRVLRTKTSAWEKQRTFDWPILTQPRELALSLAESVGVKIANPELIEHDLWAAETLPELTPVEMLSVLLIGFDLTFVLSEDGKTITLVSLPDAKDLMVSQSYTLKNELSISDLLRVAPAIDVNQSGRRVLVKGMLEDHELIRALLSGKLKPDERGELIPLEHRRFEKIKIVAPASDVIKNLANSGIRVVYDADTLRQHGIDLQQLVKIDVKEEISPEEFFATLFGPLGLECELSGITVRLKPKE